MNTDFAGQRVMLYGFGIEGASSADFFLRHGADVTILDDRPREVLDTTALADLEQRGASVDCGNRPRKLQADIIIRTPGMHPSHPALAEARASGIRITTATNIFFERCPAPIIGVTGTKGKGTTAALIHEILKGSGRTSILGGNIGTPMLSFLDNVHASDVVVLELSSFQLMDASRSPHVAVVLMVTSEHLDYHADVNEYVEAKAAITKFQTPNDTAIVNTDYEHSQRIVTHSAGRILSVSARRDPGTDGCFITNKRVCLRLNGEQTDVLPTDQIFLPGQHNLENVCAAVAAASVFSPPIVAVQSALKNFRGLPHRLELVGEINGVAYYNDSFATTPESTVAALAAFPRPAVLILGGSGKQSDFTMLGQAITEHPPRAILGIGQEWNRMKSSIELPSKIKIIEGLTTMSDIVHAAHDAAQPGDVVLLSPGCASFGLFRNYKDRGDQFRNQVRKMIDA